MKKSRFRLTIFPKEHYRPYHRPLQIDDDKLQRISELLDDIGVLEKQRTEEMRDLRPGPSQSPPKAATQGAESVEHEDIFLLDAVVKH